MSELHATGNLKIDQLVQVGRVCRNSQDWPDMKWSTILPRVWGFVLHGMNTWNHYTHKFCGLWGICCQLREFYGAWSQRHRQKLWPQVTRANEPLSCHTGECHSLRCVPPRGSAASTGTGQQCGEEDSNAVLRSICAYLVLPEYPKFGNNARSDTKI